MIVGRSSACLDNTQGPNIMFYDKLTQRVVKRWRAEVISTYI